MSTVKRIAEKDAESENGRRPELFEAAIRVFARYGYRKTSMDEVARAARISRQGLYLHFSTKDELFRAMVGHVLKSSFQAAEAVLKETGPPLEDRLVRAFDAWIGKHAGMIRADALDLIQAADALVGDLKKDYETRFSGAVTKAMRNSALAETCAAAGITPHQLTATLEAAARGLKCHCADREAFNRDFTVAVRVMFMASAMPPCQRARTPQRKRAVSALPAKL